MKTRPVDPAVIRVWRWHGLGLTAALTAPLALLSLVEGRYLWPALPALALMAGLLATWLWPPAAYRHLRYRVDDVGIVIRQGVFFRSHIALPRVRIQHTDVSQGPLQRRYGVATLKFYTAGSRHTKVELPGLAHQDAVELRDALLAEGRESGV